MVDPRRIALHEAGHVVVAHSVGLQAKSMSIRGTKRSEGRSDLPHPRVMRFGRASPGRPLSGLARRFYEDEFMILIAGGIAEALHLKDDEATVRTTDARRAVMWLKRITLDESEQTELQSRLGEAVLAFLQAPENWERLERLADALLSRRYLREAAIAEIVPVTG